MFRLVQKNGVEFYIIDKFEKTGVVKHCFSTKKGGVSSGIYESMNLRMHSSDTRENIHENFSRLFDAADMDLSRSVFSDQQHNDRIYCVTEKDAGKGLIRQSDISDADALITNIPGIPLVTFFADCVPLFFLDPVNRTVALAHSGWKGTVKRIGMKTVLKMINDYGCSAENILAAIGPSIQVCHFEVGDDVAEIFENEFGGSVLEKHTKYHVNMQLAIKMQLLDAGIPEANITDSGICTYCNSETLFSHRKTNGRRGNMAAVIQLEYGGDVNNEA